MSRKPKISPEEYQSILETISLQNIRLVQINAKLNEDFLGDNLTLNLHEDYKFEQNNNELIFYYTYRLSIIGPDENPAVKITAKYRITYHIESNIRVPRDFVKIFVNLTLSLLLWTYFRELVSNLIYRMGLPPLTLPMKRVLNA